MVDWQLGRNDTSNAEKGAGENYDHSDDDSNVSDQASSSIRTRSGRNVNMEEKKNL